LDAAKMEPVLLLTLAQILLRGDHTFVAERLLWQGAQHWPERADVLRAWSRVLISLGRPDAARTALSKVVGLTPTDPVAQYLLARSLLSIEPRARANDVAARAALTQVLTLAPTYRDADGVDAREIKMVIEQLDQQIAGKKPAAPR
ncbi:MAG: tetratricopeptide repeat protein, partial [Myxococcales bacterium]|nr:tetratricopeptide repeat protein [Myxococcales bacterium]